MPDVNPDILEWARRCAGLDPEEAAKKIGIANARGLTAAERLREFEAGTASPTQHMLAKMAKLYRFSQFAFYLSNIPPDNSYGENFRKPPSTGNKKNDILTSAALREISIRQELVKAAIETAGETKPLPFVKSLCPNSSVAETVSIIENTLRFQRSEFQKQRNSREAFSYFRNLTENLGVFVIMIANLGSEHTRIDSKVFRGFCLTDEIAPFVAINSNASYGAWSFTLAHELVHIWIGQSAVSDYRMTRNTENFCDDVASSLLLHDDDLKMETITNTTPFYALVIAIRNFSKAKNVSNTMIAYRLMRNGTIDRRQFRKLHSYFSKKFTEETKNLPRINHYAVQRHKSGEALQNFARRMINDGNLSYTKAGKILNVNPNIVHKFLKIEDLRS